ncbi:MAG: hypothetical protein IH602_05180 [Bryobacteraceae bacterium]|nr:hypothetical protein [Bryobacteraceae bacterium]
MLGTKITTVSLLLCATLGAQTVWLPLQVGNTWIYRTSDAGASASYTVRVDRTATFDERTYYSVVTEGQTTGLISATPLSPSDTVPVPAVSPLWLRNAEDGRIMMWDEQTSSERLYLDTAAEPGATSESSVDLCSPTSTVVSRAAEYSGPIGQFKCVLHIRYGPGTCADAGVETDYFLPWIGLVSRTTQTIAGSRRYDLVYARLGVTVISAPELSFSLSLDRSTYTANLMPPIVPENAIPQVNARITLRNTTPDPLTFDFSNGQVYELVLWNDHGNVVWRYSDGRAFTHDFHSITVSKGERTWNETIRLAAMDAAGGMGPLPAGRYVLECWLTSTEGRTFTASAPLTLNHVQ